MRSPNRTSRFIVATLAASLLAGGASAQAAPAHPRENFVERHPVATKTKVVNGKEFEFEKHLDDDGEIRTVVIDQHGRHIEERAVERARRRIVTPDLDARLSGPGSRPGEKIEVVVALELPGVDDTEEPTSGFVEVENGLVRSLRVDGLPASERAVEEAEEARARVRADVAHQRAERRREGIHGFASRHGLGNDRGVQNALDAAGTSVTLELTAGQIRALAASGDEVIRGIELPEDSADHGSLSGAMRDTSISTSALRYSSTRGNGVGIYMTESGCANESRFGNYDRLAGTETAHSRNVGGIIKAVAPGSFLYCRGGAVLPTSIDLYGSLWNSLFGWNIYPELNPPIQIINRSNGSTSTSTAYSTLDRDWDNFVYNNAIPIFNSAGNNAGGFGNGTNNVSSPAKGLNVIGVGNYDDADNTIASSSSWLDPATGNEKPEISAPGEDIIAGGVGPMSGTSMASPHSAAFAADMMSGSSYLKSKPHMVKAFMLGGATDPITGGFEKVGLGGIDFASTYYSGYFQWFEGANNSFSYFDGQDGSLDGYVSKRVYIPSYYSNTRVAISWLSRGSYVYDHRNDAHPIGMDLDMKVYDPYGRYVGGSFSWDNPFESVSFDPTVSGYYTVKIRRYANRDTSNKLRIGMIVNLH